MPALTIADLNNGKLDLDHIAEVATSIDPTAIDRMGNVKSTIKGAVDTIVAFNSRGAWTTATAYAVRDLVTSGGTWYACVAAHTSSAAFATDTASKWRVHQGVTAAELFASSGSSIVGTTQSGAGAVARTVEAALRDFITVAQFGATSGVSTTAFQAAIDSTPDGTYQTIHIPSGSYTVGSLNAGTRAIQWIAARGTSITGTLPGSLMEAFKGQMLTLPSQAAGGDGWRFEIRRTDTPLNYAAGTKAVMVVQDKDTSNLLTGESAPGVQFDFVSTGNGFVDAPTRFSNSVWSGLTATQDKTGDGSGHCYTALGQLNAVGPGGYNEMGLYQGMATNLGSVNGGMSGIEVLLADGIGAGAGQNWDTSINAVIGRVKRYNAGALNVCAFFASSEGPIAATAVLKTNTNAPNGWFAGIDFTGTVFSSGRALIMANNMFIAGAKAGGAIENIIGISATDQTTLRAVNAAGGISMLYAGGGTMMALDADANDPVVIRVGAASKRVVVGSADSGGTGFRMLRVAN